MCSWRGALLSLSNAWDPKSPALAVRWAWSPKSWQYMSHLPNGLHQHLSVSSSFLKLHQILYNWMSGLEQQEWGSALSHIVFTKPLCRKLHCKPWLFWGSQCHICPSPQDQPPWSVSKKDWWWHHQSNQWLERSEDHSETDHQNRQAQSEAVPSVPAPQLRFLGNLAWPGSSV